MLVEGVVSSDDVKKFLYLGELGFVSTCDEKPKVFSSKVRTCVLFQVICLLSTKVNHHQTSIWENTLLGANISPEKSIFDDDVPFPKVGYVSSLEDSFYSRKSK